jgi:hypothetical protein
LTTVLVGVSTVFCALCGNVGADTVFTDDFEGSTLDPFWTTEEYSGYVTFPSTAQPHSGSQSLQLNSTQTSGGKQVGVLHEFDEPVYGTISVWVNDTGADVSSSNYISLWVFNQVTHPGQWYLGVGGNDSDFGSDYYQANVLGVSVQTTQINRTQGWHEWKVTALPNSLSYEVDGINIYSGTEDMPFDELHLVMNAPSWRPGFVTYFDDFELNQVPEPSAFVMLGGAGILALVGRVWRRRKRAA